MGDMVQLLEGLASAAVAAYPALSLSIAYINGSFVNTLHHSGSLADTPTDSSVYELGSITNTFTGTLLAHAVASERLSFSTSVKDVLPELEGTAFPEDITVLSLATHTSGLPTHPPGMYDTPFHKYSGLTKETLLTFLASYDTPPPTSGPAAYSFSYLGAGLLGFVLERALETPWEQLLQEVVTGPDALDMPDTACMLTDEQAARSVQGYIHAWDYNEMVSAEQVEAWDLTKVGNFYAAVQWNWATNPLKGTGCLHATLPDMVKYARAAIDGAAQVAPSCRANYAHNAPPPSKCLPAKSDIFQLLGYAQQRQGVQGVRFEVSQPWSLSIKGNEEQVSDTSATPTETPQQNLLQRFTSAVAGMMPALFKSPTGYSIDSIGEGVGLLWMTEDWSDSKYMPSGIKFHEGDTHGSSSVLLVNPDLQLGVVLLSNFPGTNSLNFFPKQLAWKPADTLWGEIAGFPDEG